MIDDNKSAETFNYCGLIPVNQRWLCVIWCLLHTTATHHHLLGARQYVQAVAVRQGRYGAQRGKGQVMFTGKTQRQNDPARRNQYGNPDVGV